MNLYDIDKQIRELLTNGFDEDCIDEETGEILSEKVNTKLANLELDEALKLEGITLFVKELDRYAADIKAEEDALYKRRKAKENKRDWFKEYISNYLILTGKTKFETPKCALSFRTSEQLFITDESAMRKYAEDNDLLKYKEPELDKMAVKKLIKDGAKVNGVELIKKQNLQIR